MEKYRAIPQGYMTVGELAKKMNTTVRTLQYYDKEGILTPSGTSDGGRRLYTDKDMIMLHQIQSMKYLGFSLDDIKTRLVTLETPEEVVAALTGQANAVREKIASLSEVLETIEKLKEETVQMRTVNFRKYADIVTLLQEGGDYWMIKGISDEMWEHIRTRFDDELAKNYLDRQMELFTDAAKLENANVPPGSEQGIAIGKRWLEMLNEFTGGDMSLLPEMEKFGMRRDLWKKEWRAAWEKAEGFLTAAMGAYIGTLDQNPFEGASNAFVFKQQQIIDKAVKLKNEGILPESEQGIEVGKTWFELLYEITGGDMSLIPKMQQYADNVNVWDSELRAQWENAEGFITEALGAYINKLGYNPFEGLEGVNT